MNYIQILRDSFRLFRTTRLILVFGFLSLIFTIPLSSLAPVRDNPILACLYLLIFIGVLSLTMIATGSLCYVIQQAFLSKKVSFSEAWVQGKSKMLRNLGLIVVSIPILMVEGFLTRLMTTRTPSSLFLWFIFLATNLFISSFFTFGFCAVIIDNVKVFAVAWTSFLITINNLSSVLVITGTIYFVHLLITALVVTILASGLFGVELPATLTLDYPTYQKLVTIPIVAWIDWIFNLFLFPLEIIMLTLAYIKFTKEVSYPSLVQRQTTA